LLRHFSDYLVALGPLGIFLLSVLDSSGVPVAGVFDALLILIAVKTPQVAWLCAGLAVVGSTAGNVILYLTARKGGQRFLRESAPEGRSAKFREWFRRYGLVTVFVPALVPIPMPLKLFVISAGALGTPLGTFVSVVLAARVLRYFGEAWLGIKLGEESTKFLKDHAVHFMLGAAVLFAVLVIFIRIRDRRAAA
jgi:membrane protein YqaA with SNARE-associated domain